MRSKGDTFVSPLLFSMIKRILICIVILLQFGMAHAQAKRTEVPIGDSPTQGPAEAPITIVEFIDFQ